MSLRLRLALFGAAVVALTLLLFGLLIYALVSAASGSDQDTALRNRAHQAVASLAATPAADLAPRSPVAPADLTTSTEVFIEVRAADGSLVYTTGQLDGAPLDVPQQLLGQASARGNAFATQGDAGRGRQFRIYVQRFSGGYVVAGQTTRVPQSNRSGIVAFLVISAVPTLLAALAASWLVAGRALRPLKEVAGTADEIGRERDFGRRLPERRSKDEVALLTLSFNRMLSHLEDAYRRLAGALEAQRRFVADASHELRTPLATIQGNAGLLAEGPPLAAEVRREAAADIAGETERMARLVDRLLALAQADAGLQLELAPVELRPIVVEVCRQAAALHPQPTLTVDAAEACVAGDEDSLRQLLWILLDNALRHGRSAVSVRLVVEAGWARLIVEDDGPGIPSEERERVFERFYRADPARGGTGAGLGLAIARSITEQHAGRILATQPPTGGATFYVDLPLLRTVPPPCGEG
jgi:signal transduction histidine kinase